jgi:hypothetical protein
VKAYLDCMGGLAVPTADQTTAFADHVAGAHSWYKHLPPSPPGALFVFFLDPDAGRQVALQGMQRTVHDILGREECWHYSMMPTAEYRQRFGCWTYAVADNPHHPAPFPRPEVALTDGSEVLPPVVVENWSCRLTAAVHARYRAIGGPWRVAGDSARHAEDNEAQYELLLGTLLRVREELERLLA